MYREPQRAAKAQMVAQMEAGQSWQAAATSAGIQTSQANARTKGKLQRDPPPGAPPRTAALQAPGKFQPKVRSRLLRRRA
jgi:hypothetical protein